MNVLKIGLRFFLRQKGMAKEEWSSIVSAFFGCTSAGILSYAKKLSSALEEDKQKSLKRTSVEGKILRARKNLKIGNQQFMLINNTIKKYFVERLALIVHFGLLNFAVLANGRFKAGFH